MPGDGHMPNATKRPEQKYNNYAIGNRGGFAPHGNMNGKAFGFLLKVFPESDEIREILESMTNSSPIEMLWENIVIQYTAICRAQRLMWVKTQQDIIKMPVGGDQQLIKLAEDRQATFMKSQSAAMNTLTNMLVKYEEMLRLCNNDEEQLLRINKLKIEIKKLASAEASDEKSITEHNEKIMTLAGMLQAPVPNRDASTFGE